VLVLDLLGFCAEKRADLPGNYSVALNVSVNMSDVLFWTSHCAELDPGEAPSCAGVWSMTL